MSLSQALNQFAQNLGRYQPLIPLSEPLQGFSDATGLNLHIGKAHKESHNRISLSETPQNARKIQPHK